MRTVTPFDTSQHHIHTEFYVADQSGRRLRFDGVIDTGAPWTEFSDEFLARAGLVELSDDEIPIKPGLETQKYAKILLPSLTICGHRAYAQLRSGVFALVSRKETEQLARQTGYYQRTP